MAFTQNISSYFARNIGDLTLKTDVAVKITVAFGAQTFEFVLTPINGMITLRTSEIVRGLLENYDPLINDGEQLSISLPMVFIYARDDEGNLLATWYNYVINGGYNQHRITDEQNYLWHHFLTWRPQIAYTSYGVKEQLTVANIGDASGTTNVYRKICAKLYFRQRIPEIITLAEVASSSNLHRIDCSCSTIMDKAESSGIDDEIVAYDVYGEATVQEPAMDEGLDWKFVTYNNVPYAQRFVVRPPSLDCTYFFFQNTLGGFDTIVASGIVKSSASGDILTATNNRVEQEIANDYVESWEVNTGYIATDQEKNLWHEFLRSTNRYILLPDGTHRRIIIEEYKAEHTRLQLGSFTFKYHYSTPDNGNYYERQDLTEFESNTI